MTEKTLEFIEISKKCDAFFKIAVDKAIENQHVQISDEAIFYLIGILSGILKSGDGLSDKTLAERFSRALSDSSSREKAKQFRTLGDSSLIIAGIWWQSLLRKLVDVNYYISIGKLSYQKAGEASSNNLSDLFEELSENFTGLVNVLIEATRCITEARMTNSDVLRLYETWLRTHNTFLEQKLRSFGINPVDVGTTKQ